MNNSDMDIELAFGSHRRRWARLRTGLILIVECYPANRKNVISQQDKNEWNASVVADAASIRTDASSIGHVTLDDGPRNNDT